MDYECDFGYYRKPGSQGICELQTNDSKSWAASVANREEEMCDEYGYYEVSRGYRTIPGNICTGGLQLAPYRYKCSMGGFLYRILNFTSLLTICALSAIIYYGWPIIEGIILVLPIPDPKRTKARLVGLCSQLGSYLMGLVPQKT